MNINYDKELNDSQRAAVFYNDGPLLVIAGAGSGKTRVLTYKIAYLLENGYNPSNILALTFTNKAAREMKERIAGQVGSQYARQLWMGTFHSIFSRILRVEAERIGFTSQFTIYDASDSKSLIHSIIKEMELDDKIYKVGTVLNRISNAKNHLVTPTVYAANKEVIVGDRAIKMPSISLIYQRYWQRCRQAGAMDFDDLLLYTYVLFRDFPEVLDRYSNQFRYILVDEYQDTNVAQHRIVCQLTKWNKHICVVGDDAQSIYSFRGADIDNILNFNRTFSDAKTFKLEENYRSTQLIVSAANSLIEKNERQIHKEVYSNKEKGEPLTVFKAYSDTEEGEIVINKISELHRKEHSTYDQFAILFRTNAQSRVFEEVLRKRSIPYRIYGGLSFYQRKEIKDVISYFRLVTNPHDEEALKRCINYPARGIGNTTLMKIINSASVRQESLWNVICHTSDNGLEVNKGTLAKLRGFQQLIEGFILSAGEKDAYELGQQIIRESGIMNDIYQDNTPENISRKENVEELINGMNDFCATRQEEDNPNISLADFLADVSLLTDQDIGGDEGEKVTLMTIHSAKGLEFGTVFVVGMEENLFPSFMSGDSPKAMEEERRLFYVAVTRAEKHCFLSYARSRFRYGKVEFSSPSRFLKDIDCRYLKQPLDADVSNNDGFSGGTTHSKRFTQTVRVPETSGTRVGNSSLGNSSSQIKKMQSVSLSTSSSDSNSKDLPNLKVGQIIEHQRFGEGVVLQVEGTGDNAKAKIKFKNVGEKQLLLRFARFKVIG